MRVISANRLMKGGAAILAAIIKNHHIAKEGEITRNPWFTIRLRE